MSTSVQVFFGTLVFIGYIVAPVTLVWGWTRWAVERDPRTVSSVLSMIGFVSATASAALAVSAIIYANLIHGFRYYDPLLLRIFRSGILLSLTGILFSVGGLWRRNALRWYAPVSAFATLAFWVMAAAGE